LYLRVRATGGRSWVLRRKRGGHIEVITVGAWPALGLAQARLKAGALAGKDVSTLTLGALLDTWHTDVVRKTYRRPREVRGYIERLDPALKVTKLRNLERVEVRHALRRYAEERGPVAANRALSILKTALRFAVDAGYLEISPVDRLSNEPDRRGVGRFKITDCDLKARSRAAPQIPALRVHRAGRGHALFGAQERSRHCRQHPDHAGLCPHARAADLEPRARSKTRSARGAS